jgi:hypothetical protein
MVATRTNGENLITASSCREYWRDGLANDRSPGSGNSPAKATSARNFGEVLSQLLLSHYRRTRPECVRERKSADEVTFVSAVVAIMRCLTAARSPMVNR